MKLNRPYRTPGASKKSAVRVRNPRTGNIVTVRFGDPKMSIKKNQPGRRKSFLARHRCSTPGPRTKARFWSCKAWK